MDRWLSSAYHHHQGQSTCASGKWDFAENQWHLQIIWPCSQLTAEENRSCRCVSWRWCSCSKTQMVWWASRCSSSGWWQSNSAMCAQLWTPGHDVHGRWSHCKWAATPYEQGQECSSSGAQTHSCQQAHSQPHPLEASGGTYSPGHVPWKWKLATVESAAVDAAAWSLYEMDQSHRGKRMLDHGYDVRPTSFAALATPLNSVAVGKDAVIIRIPFHSSLSSRHCGSSDSKCWTLCFVDSSASTSTTMDAYHGTRTHCLGSQSCPSVGYYGLVTCTSWWWPSIGATAISPSLKSRLCGW